MDETTNKGLQALLVVLTTCVISGTVFLAIILKSGNFYDISAGATQAVMLVSLGLSLGINKTVKNM